MIITADGFHHKYKIRPVRTGWNVSVICLIAYDHGAEWSQRELCDFEELLAERNADDCEAKNTADCGIADCKLNA